MSDNQRLNMCNETGFSLRFLKKTRSIDPRGDELPVSVLSITSAGTSVFQLHSLP